MNKEEKKKLLQKALDYHHNGRLNLADDIYKEILSVDQSDFDANHLHATILSQNHEYAKAIKFFAQAYEHQTPTCELLNNYAIALRNLRAFSECENMLLEAVELDKYFAKSYINLSNCFISQNKYEDAIDILRKSIKLNLNLTKAHHSITKILFSKLSRESDQSTLDEIREHLNFLRKVNDKSIIADCALYYFNIGDIEIALELFKASEKMYSDSVPNIETLKKMNNKNIIKTFIAHEFEQIRHIDSDTDGIRNMKITQKFYDHLEALYSKASDQYDEDDYVFISDLHKIKYNKPPKVSGSYLNKALMFNEIEKEYTSSDPEIVVVDDFLSQDFLKELRVFFRCSNIFKYPYLRGYIGAFLGKGMANRALLEFSTELKNTFQKIFLNYYLSQAWSFKYDSKRDGIGIHADDAKVNVNFWITDDSANKDPNSGGMIVWKKMPQKNASFKDFNSLESMDKIHNEIKDTEFVKVPYRSNRAVIFNSKLYHVTDKMDFNDNYMDRRVNVTLLYK
tara:strand:- start:2999 stop:4528 length:1530 start_codon:yes stop_codon:yes gene_type:complete